MASIKGTMSFPFLQEVVDERLRPEGDFILAAHNAYAALSYTGELCKMAEPVKMPFGRQAPCRLS